MSKVLLDLAELDGCVLIQRADHCLALTLCRVLLSHFRCSYVDFALTTLAVTLHPLRMQARAPLGSLVRVRCIPLRSHPLHSGTGVAAIALAAITGAAHAHLRGASPALQQSPCRFAHTTPLGRSFLDNTRRRE
jgi:hypothetical protein